jgi:hypothetical protein
MAPLNIALGAKMMRPETKYTRSGDVHVPLGKDSWLVFTSLEACLQARDEGTNDLAARSLRPENGDLKKLAGYLLKRARHSRCVP